MKPKKVGRRPKPPESRLVSGLNIKFTETDRARLDAVVPIDQAIWARSLILKAIKRIEEKREAWS